MSEVQFCTTERPQFFEFEVATYRKCRLRLKNTILEVFTSNVQKWWGSAQSLEDWGSTFTYIFLPCICSRLCEKNDTLRSCCMYLNIYIYLKSYSFSFWDPSFICKIFIPFNSNLNLQSYVDSSAASRKNVLFFMISVLASNALATIKCFDFTPSSIYSCSIGHILEHEFCHLGCWAVSEKFLKRRNFCLLFGVDFLCFHGQKNIFLNIFFYIVASALKTCFKKKWFFS